LDHVVQSDSNLFPAAMFLLLHGRRLSNCSSTQFSKGKSKKARGLMKEYNTTSYVAYSRNSFSQERKSILRTENSSQQP
jgi:hypothetical protein